MCSASMYYSGRNEADKDGQQPYIARSSEQSIRRRVSGCFRLDRRGVPAQRSAKDGRLKVLLLAPVQRQARHALASAGTLDAQSLGFGQCALPTAERRYGWAGNDWSN